MNLPNKKLKEEEFEKKVKRREKKKRVGMKVSGGAVKRLQRIIGEKR